MTLPKDVYDVHRFSDPPSIFGPADSEYSFKTSKEGILQITNEQLFRDKNLIWKRGMIYPDGSCPYSPDHECEGSVNRLWGGDKKYLLKDNESLLTVIEDRSPVEDQTLFPNYTQIVVDPVNFWVLVITRYGSS